MEPLQMQVSMLSHKVDALYKIIEQLTSKLSEVLSDSVLTSNQGRMSPVGWNVGRYHYTTYNSLEMTLEHKDVLVDDNGSETNGYSAEQDLTPEVQVHRLTGQLTAAYNRIAALEEQLLATRVH